jgi:hypothetical protein
MNKCNIFLPILLSALTSFATTLPTRAQSAGARTVGDGTAFIFSPGRSEGYGVYSGDIGGQVGEPLYSHHHRLGESTGIGSSTLQTTSVTSESTPAAVSSFAPAAGQFALTRPNLPSSTFGFTGTPALNGFTVSPANGIFSGNGLTSPYAETGSVFSGQVSQPSSLFQDLNAVPSFSRQHSHAVLPLTGSGNDDVFKKVQPQF